MTWVLTFTATARKEIEKLDPSVREQIRKDLDHLAENPFGGKFMHGRLKGIRSWRSGDYRILYAISSKPAELLIQRVANRREVYR